MDSIHLVRHSNANSPRFATWTREADSNVVQLRIRRPLPSGNAGACPYHEAALAEDQGPPRRN